MTELLPVRHVRAGSVALLLHETPESRFHGADLGVTPGGVPGPAGAYEVP